MSFADDIEAAVERALRKVLPEIIGAATVRAPAGPMSLVAFSRAVKRRPATVSEWIRTGKIRAEHDPKAHGGKGVFRIDPSQIAKARGLK